jgi:hypothetical protein
VPRNDLLLLPLLLLQTSWVCSRVPSSAPPLLLLPLCLVAAAAWCWVTGR